MQSIITYDTGMYSQLSNISSEIQIFKFGYLSSGHTVFTSAKMVPRAKNLGDTDLKFFPPFIVQFLRGSSIKPLILCSHPIFNAHNLCLKQNVCMCVLIYKLL